jgi:hypothetical protein
MKPPTSAAADRKLSEDLILSKPFLQTEKTYDRWIEKARKLEAQQTDSLSGLRTQIEAALLSWFEDELIALQSKVDYKEDYAYIGELRQKVAKRIIQRLDSAEAAKKKEESR